MSVMRIDEESSGRLRLLSIKIDRRRRFFPPTVGVKSDQFAVTQIAITAERDLKRTTAPAEVSETSAGRSNRWVVVLFDDDHHSMDYVIWALLKTLPELTTADASLIMLEAHNTGKGVVTLCGKEQAVQYRDALRVLQLKCDVEPGW
ncbi:ATP-dependent Clp protease adaptor ClpS [Dehalococcoides mccartyi]|nr:ATP-dependent Clp protease adaptor ClpS [Dehalococcoides mccartyi]